MARVTDGRVGRLGRSCGSYFPYFPSEIPYFLTCSLFFCCFDGPELQPYGPTRPTKNFKRIAIIPIQIPIHPCKEVIKESRVSTTALCRSSSFNHLKCFMPNIVNDYSHIINVRTQIQRPTGVYRRVNPSTRTQFSLTSFEISS